MPRKIIFHIGASKTGSSAIQAFIRINQNFLTQHGFVIPDHMLGLGTRITGEHVFAFQNLISEPDNSLLRETLKTLYSEADEGKTILVSAENLCNLGNHRFFSGLLEDFEPRVILYIRRQDDLLTSAWQQWHSKVETDLHAWIIKGMTKIGHWDKVIEDWESVVGEGNVDVRIFQREDMAEGDLLRDFLQALGLDPKSEDAQYEVGTVNPSYSDVITQLVSGNRGIFSNSHDNAFYKIVGSLTGKHYVENRKVSLITRDQRESILSYYDQINQRVCQKYFPDRPQLFAPVKHHNYQYLDEQEMMRRQLKFLTHMVFKLAEGQGRK
ncbi:hypothetical protein [Ruegeria aquimaris]|uniref:Sulfotransferase domain protein n=1 Tax=Ruegeria aquimaris TaxID=2984333 RepID=A0ABT3AR71_9RHOB|nr:hypothetical protein [Ruegeria sp. XHP0148]MCV2891178.1 hypothetical protein [Ruegeria sp. XHP0148]